MRLLTRIAAWCHRFTVATATLGLWNAGKVFLVARFFRRCFHIRLPTGLPFMFRGKLDHGIVSHFYKYGYYIEDTGAQPISKIVDCGAYIGDETARFAIHYPKAQIVAIEAEPSNYEMLARNFAALDRVVTIHAAVWPRQTHLQVVQGRVMEGSHVVETAAGERTVPSCGIPDIMRRMQWDTIDILKIDIEGAEFELFTIDSAPWIDKVSVFIFEIPDHDRPGTTQFIFNSLSGLKFNTYISGENLVLIKSGVPWKLRVVPGFRNCAAVSLW